MGTTVTVTGLFKLHDNAPALPPQHLWPLSPNTQLPASGSVQPGEELQDRPAQDSYSDPPSREAQHFQPPLSCQLPIGQVHLQK